MDKFEHSSMVHICRENKKNEKSRSSKSPAEYRLVCNQNPALPADDSSRLNGGLISNDYLGLVLAKQRILQNLTLAVIPGILIVLGGVALGWVVIPVLIESYISGRLAVSPEINPEFYAAWEAFPLPIYLRVYLFHVSNPDEVRAGGLPNLKEMGPYTFLEKKVKSNISHDEATDTVSYKVYSSYHFEPTLSGTATLADRITILNVPYAAAAIKIAQDVPWPFKNIANSILSGYKEPLFLEKSVEQVLFQGWRVPFLEKMEDDVGLTFIANHTFGFFVGQNGSADGPFTIYRGIRDKSKLGVILKYKNESTLDTWGEGRNSYCNKITGTDGTIFPPHLTKQTLLGFFGPELCHSLYATYKEDSVFRDITGYRFTLSPSIFGDSLKYPENRCYCSEEGQTNYGHCLKQGAMEMGPCKDGAPLAISYPHFLDADEEYQRKSGLTPDRARHETGIVLEPQTGIILQGSKKLQVNLMMKPVKGHTALRKVPEMLFPLMWADESTELDDHYGQIVKTNLTLIWWANILTKSFSIITTTLISLWVVYKNMAN